jgi:FAD synthetase
MTASNTRILPRLLINQYDEGDLLMGYGLEERVRAYIMNVEKAVNLIDSSRLDKESKEVFELAKAYLSDANYYLDKGDASTSLACVAYAEGLLDALRKLGRLSFEWEPLTRLLSRPKVIVAGSFEILHPGHIHLIREAWELGKVYVIVARDQSIRRFKRREPIVPEDQRLRVVESVKYVHKAILGDESDFLKPVLDIKPDIILLGPDQWITPEELKEGLEKRNLPDVKVIRLQERIGDELYSTSGIVRRVCSICKGSEAPSTRS